VEYRTASRTMVSPDVGNVSVVRRVVDITMESGPIVIGRQSRPENALYLFPGDKKLSSLMARRCNCEIFKDRADTRVLLIRRSSELSGFFNLTTASAT